MRPDDPAVSHILERAMVARLATVSKTGRPHANPLYFVVEGPHIHLGTVLGTLAARNVAANPAVQILFEVESDPDDQRVVRVEGAAEIRTDREMLRRYRRRDARKYFGSPRSWWLTLTHTHQMWLTRRYLSAAGANEGHCVIVVEPTNAEILT